MNVVVYVGNLASREVCQEYEFYTNKKTGRLIKLNILSTTYEVVLKNRAHIKIQRRDLQMIS